MANHSAHATGELITHRLDKQAKVADLAPVCLIALEQTPLSGLYELDGVQMESGDRVAVTGQDNPDENGIYVASTTSWMRSADLNNPNEFVAGRTFYVTKGPNRGFYVWENDPDDGSFQAVPIVPRSTLDVSTLFNKQ